MTIARGNISLERNGGSWLKPFLDTMRAGGGYVLEIGCGPGEDAAALDAWGFRVVAFDLARAPIRRAVTNAPAARFFVADSRSPLPVRSAAVGSVVASLSIHYFPWRTTRALITEVRRVLQPGGIFVFRVNATDDVNFGAMQGDELEPHYYHVPPDGRNNRPYKRFFDEASIRALLRPGWRITHLAHRTISRYETPKQVWECCAFADDDAHSPGGGR